MSAIVKFDFHGDMLDVVRDEAGVWVSVKRVCEPLSVDPDTQAKKLREKAWATTALKTVVAEDGKTREMFCVALDSLPMWLATIEPSRVAERVRPKLGLFQRECARVLRDHFFGVSKAAVLDEARIVALCVRTVMAVMGEAQRPTFAAEACIGRSGATAINARLRAAASLMAPPGDKKAYLSVLATLTMDLRSSLGFAGTGRGWANFPMARWSEMRAKLEELSRLSARVGSGRQLSLIGGGAS
jgi:hypothetical protein